MIGFVLTPLAARDLNRDAPRYTLKHCHLEQARGSEATESASKDPEDGYTTMLIQGVSAMDCPGNRISLPQFSVRSCQRGFNFSISPIFFSRRST
jgi:hypothetical protein